MKRELAHARAAGTAAMPSLTGLRGLAALAVVGFHYQVPGFSHGWLAVDVFFALSGYVLAHVYRDGLEPTAFAWARFARLAPAHLVATGVWCLVGLELGAFSPWHALGGLLLVQVVNPPTWSLTVEVSAYAIFPILRQCRPMPLLIVGTAVGLIGLTGPGLHASVLPGWGPFPGLSLNGIARGFGWFACGIGLYGVGWRPRQTWLLDNPVSLWLGEISYPLYLIHFLPWALLGASRAWFCLPASLLAATVISRMIEVPARRWLREVAGPKKAAAPVHLLKI